MGRNVTTARIKLRLYIEGIKTKINSVMVSSGVWTLPTAGIIIPSSEYSKHIPYGTKIHVFEWDAHIENWILLFDGYVTGIMHQKSSASWNTQLSCIGYGRIWQRIYKYMYTLDMLQDKEFYDKYSGKAELVPVRSYFHNLIKVYADDNDVFSAVSNILTWKTGKKYMKNGVMSTTPGKTERLNSLPGFVNKFLYGAPNLAKRLHGLVTSDVIKKILQMKEFKQMLSGSSNGMSGETTLFSLAALVLRYSFHELLSINQPTYTSTGLKEYIIKPVSHYLYPPKCNVVHPGFVTSISYNQNYENEPTRIACSVAPWAFKAVGMDVPSGLTSVKYAPKLGGAFEDMSIDYKDNGYAMSTWEKKYGLNISHTSMPDDIGVAFKSNEEKLKTYLNMVYMDSCSTSRRLSVTVDPMMQIVPGASTLILDGTETRDHLFGFVSSVSRVISAAGTSSLSMTISNPRPYSEIVDGYASEVDPLVKDYGELKKYYKLLGTKPAFTTNDAETVRTETDTYAKMEKTRWYRDICTQEQFMEFVGIAWSGTDLSGSLYDTSVLSRDKFWGRKTPESEPTTLSIPRRELIQKHNSVLALGGIRG